MVKSTGRPSSGTKDDAPTPPPHLPNRKSATDRSFCNLSTNDSSTLSSTDLPSLAMSTSSPESVGSSITADAPVRLLVPTSSNMSSPATPGQDAFDRTLATNKLDDKQLCPVSPLCPGAQQVRGFSVESKSDSPVEQQKSEEQVLPVHDPPPHHDDKLQGKNHHADLVVAAEVALDDEELALQVAQRLQLQIKEEVNAHLSAHRQTLELAEATIVGTSTEGATKCSHSDYSGDGKVCSWSRRTLLSCLLFMLLLITGGIVAGVLLLPRNEEDGADDAVDNPLPSPLPSPSPTWSMGTEELFQELKPWIVRKNVRSDWDMFNDSKSPQSRALKWLTTDSISTSENRTTITVLERYVLMVLYYSTDGDRWNKRDFSYGIPSEVCQWNNDVPVKYTDSVGIHCEGGESSNNVTHVLLPDMELFGTLPWELSLLSRLVMLNFDRNDLLGTIPIQYNELSYLEIFWVASNALNGTLPDDLPSSLQSVDYSSNALTGTLPSAWGERLTDLFYLGLGQNDFTGSLPSPWRGLESLQTLNLELNRISGTIPPDMFSSWPNATLLFLNVNKFSGPLPSSLGQLTRLQQFWIHENRLNGTIPSEIGQLTAMKRFGIFQNELIGTVPSEVGQMSELQALWIYSNQLTGTLPTELSEVLTLTNFSFHNNTLTGAVNDTLCLSDQWIVLEADCLEVDCPCCTGCCTPTSC